MPRSVLNEDAVNIIVLYILKIFKFVNFYVVLFPAARHRRTSSKNLISSISSDTLRESASIKLILNHTKIVLHVK